MRKGILFLMLSSLVLISLSTISLAQTQVATASSYRGDIDENGKVDIFDLLEMLKMLGSQQGHTERKRQISDMDTNGKVDIFDLLGMLKVLGGQQPEIIYWGPTITGLSNTVAAVGDTLVAYLEYIDETITVADIKAQINEQDVEILTFTHDSVGIIIPQWFAGGQLRLVVADDTTNSVLTLVYIPGIVNSTSDSGTGSLRYAIANASPGDSITFDLSVFPPASPDTIVLVSPLPELVQGNLVIDASDAGVVIDGSMISEPEAIGISVISNDNVIRGLHIMRNFAIWPAWTNTNFYNYLTRLYALNQSLPDDRRIRHHFTDMSVNWSDLTTEEEYEAYRSSLRNRDERMAQSVIEKMSQLSESGSTPPKCLVVMNYRHGFDLTGRSPEVKRINTYEFLKDTFGNRAANVLLNTRILISVPIAGGLWDAAFGETGNRPAGFDFEGSPFGKDPFDMFPFNPTVKKMLKYRDVFTGLVYAHPLDDQYLQNGIPRYFEGFEEEVLRRARLVSEDYPQKIKYLIYREKKGDVARKSELPGHEIETLLELCLLALNSVGLMIGVGTIALGWGVAMWKRTDILGKGKVLDER